MELTTILGTAVSSVIAAFAAAFVTWLLNRPKKRREAQEQIANDIKLCKLGIQAELKNSLKLRYEEWIKRGYAPIDAKDDLERMYKVYHSLGANGVMDGLRERFLALPEEKPITHRKK